MPRDLVHEGALAIKSGTTSAELGNMIHAHPTLAEAVMEAAEDVHEGHPCPPTGKDPGAVRTFLS